MQKLESGINALSTKKNKEKGNNVNIKKCNLTLKEWSQIIEGSIIW